MRLNRSTSFMFGLDPRKFVLSVKFVVVTTSVLPSQRPRESPIHWRMAGDAWGRPSSGMMRTSWIISVRITT